ncbi:MAG: efflux RND transporter periplasmic adaptor subunit, partial [Bacteroidia bacterium]|nr:efflux RND transporter periplasmic adaptor subunit [Bacteroidia bacterium]
MKYIPTSLAATLMAMVLLLPACTESNSSQEAIQLEETAEDEPFSLTAEQFSGAGMAVGGFTEQTFSQVVKTTGMFDVPPEFKASVSAYYGGYVKTISLLPGQRVRKGQLLFTLENPEYIQMQQDFLEAKGQLAYLKNDYERQASLRSENVTSQKVFLKAESDYNMTLA